MEEIWKPVPGFECAYEVSSLGRLRSFDRVGPHKRYGSFFKRGRILAPGNGPGGYLLYVLCVAQVRKTVPAHKLVLWAFVGPRPDGMEACHNDGNRQNNCLSNLRWDTQAANNRDKIAHGRSGIGAKNPNVKLTERQVLEIRKSSVSRNKICKDYGVHPHMIYLIRSRKNWKHLP
jgi:hypothetical protein